MIKQILPSEVNCKNSRLFEPLTRDLYFEIQNTPSKVVQSFNNSLADFLDNVRDYPSGIYKLDTIIENKVLRVTYNVNEITEEKVIIFTKSLKL